MPEPIGLRCHQAIGRADSRVVPVTFRRRITVSNSKPPDVADLAAKRDVAGLIAALARDNAPDTRVAAARALGALGDAKAVGPLKRALVLGVKRELGEGDQDLDDRVIRGTAVEALDALSWVPDDEEAGATYWAVKGDWDKVAERGISAVPALVFAQSSPSDEVRLAAEATLRRVLDANPMDGHG